MIWLLFLLCIDPRYHTFDEVAQELDAIANHYPEIAKLDTMGYSSFDSLPILALKISDNVTLEEDEPAILYIACHHAEEILGIEICMYMIGELIADYNVDSLHTYWVNNREIWFVPLLNPDGHGVVMSPPETTWHDTTWRKNKHDNNDNGVFELAYDGVDLNRNYDFYWSWGGSSNPSGEFYRGAFAFSEPELLSIRELALKHNFVFCISYHSARYGLPEVIYYPWHWSGGYCPDYPFIRTVADSLSKRIINDQGNGHYNALTGEGLEGNTRNWLYGVFGTFAFDIEVSTTTIQPGYMVDDICQRNAVGAYYLLERMDESAVTGWVRDSLTGEPVAAEIIITGYYDPNLPPRRCDGQFGRFFRILKPGTYNIQISRPGYITKYLNDIQVLSDQTTVLDVQLISMGRESPIIGAQKKIRTVPNPSKNLVRIQFDPQLDFSSLAIYDLAGRLIKTIESTAGQITWTGDDEQGRSVAEGIYWVVGRTDDDEITQKVIVIRD